MGQSRFLTLHLKRPQHFAFAAEFLAPAHPSVGDTRATSQHWLISTNLPSGNGLKLQILRFAMTLKTANKTVGLFSALYLVQLLTAG